MKISLFSTIVFATFGAGAVLDRRQGILGTIGAAFQTKPHSVISAEPQPRKDAKWTIARWGPLELPAMKLSISFALWIPKTLMICRIKAQLQVQAICVVMVLDMVEYNPENKLEQGPRIRMGFSSAK